MKKDAPIVILLGPPGSGKGTQAKKLSQEFGWNHFATGDLFREILAHPERATKEEFQELKKIEKGQRVDAWLAIRLGLKEVERRLQAEGGLVLDGVTRDAEQAKAYGDFFEQHRMLGRLTVIWIHLSDAETIRRLTKRRVCKNCEHILPFTTETEGLNTCPKCGGALVIRGDDTEEIILERIRSQGTTVQKPVAEYFKKYGVYQEVNGEQPIEAVYTDIKTILGV